MSWSTSVPATPAAEFEAAVDAAEIPTYGDWQQPPEQLEQLELAKGAVKTLFVAGAVGGGGWFAASMAGHATSGHQSYDSISVSLYRATAPVTPEPALAASSAVTP